MKNWMVIPVVLVLAAVGFGQCSPNPTGGTNCIAPLNVVPSGTASVPGMLGLQINKTLPPGAVGQMTLAPMGTSLWVDFNKTGYLQIPTLDASGALSVTNIPSLPEAQITNLASDLASKIATSQMGIANGVATLDATGKIPLAQLPPAGPSIPSSFTCTSWSWVYQGKWVMQFSDCH